MAKTAGIAGSVRARARAVRIVRTADPVEPDVRRRPGVKHGAVVDAGGQGDRRTWHDRLRLRLEVDRRRRGGDGLDRPHRRRPSDEEEEHADEPGDRCRSATIPDARGHSAPLGHRTPDPGDSVVGWLRAPRYARLDENVLGLRSPGTFRYRSFVPRRPMCGRATWATQRAMAIGSCRDRVTFGSPASSPHQRGRDPSIADRTAGSALEPSSDRPGGQRGARRSADNPGVNAQRQLSRSR